MSAKLEMTYAGRAMIDQDSVSSDELLNFWCHSASLVNEAIADEQNPHFQYVMVGMPTTKKKAWAADRQQRALEDWFKVHPQEWSWV